MIGQSKFKIGEWVILEAMRIGMDYQLFRNIGFSRNTNDLFLISGRLNSHKKAGKHGKS